MPMYRKKPVVVEAIQWDGTYRSYELIEKMTLAGKPYHTIGRYEDKLVIPTLEGVITASKGDYIIKGVKGEFYPRKPGIFEAIYEAVE